MKILSFITALFLSASVFAQTSVVHGTVYGTKPDTTAIQPATGLEAFMGKKARISTTIRGKVLKVVNPKGGWINIDGGNGRVIAAHFSKIGINVPTQLTGKTVIVQGVAAKQFIADDSQHFAGDTATGKKQHAVKTNANHRVGFEMTGLMVEK